MPKYSAQRETDKRGARVSVCKTVAICWRLSVCLSVCVSLRVSLLVRRASRRSRQRAECRADSSPQSTVCSVWTSAGAVLRKRAKLILFNCHDNNNANDDNNEVT